MTRQRARSLLLLLFLSLLLTPWVHSLIKPYRLRLDVIYHHDAPRPLPVYVYFSNHKNVPNQFQADQVESMFTVPSQETPPLDRFRAMLASRKPISGLRLDPAVTPGETLIGSLSVHTLTGAVHLSAEQLEPLVRAGPGITDVRLDNGVLHFKATGDDPHFLLPLPPQILDVPSWLVYLNRLLAWAVAAVLVLFVAVVLRKKHHLGFTGRLRWPLVLQDGRTARSAWGGLALDIAVGVLLLQAVLGFVNVYTHFDPSPIVHALDDDGVGTAVPVEVRDMKALVRRHGTHAFVLADGMANGDDESEIFQRATEYLYPSRVVHQNQSEWVFGLVEGHLGPDFGNCQLIDKENFIVLYVCRP